MRHEDGRAGWFGRAIWLTVAISFVVALAIGGHAAREQPAIQRGQRGPVVQTTPGTQPPRPGLDPGASQH